MHAAMNQSDPVNHSPQSNPGQTSKQLREQRLQWQSRVVLLSVLPIAAYYCVVGSLLHLHVAPVATAIALSVCAGFALLVWSLRAATPFAAIAGGVLTACVYLESIPVAVTNPDSLAHQLLGWMSTGIAPLMALFVLTYLATKYRRNTKALQGTAEAKQGRNAAQVCANLGVAATASIFVLPFVLLMMAAHAHFASPQYGIVGLAAPILWTPALAALAEATADTISSEIGQVLGGAPRLLTTLRPVAAGTDGAISLAGTAAGAAAAALVVGVGMISMALDLRTAGIAFAAGIFGLFFDSLLGATAERRGYLNNDAVNFLSTLAAAIVAGALSLLLR